jgi:gluconate 2-dehydrogenase gamma chain
MDTITRRCFVATVSAATVAAVTALLVRPARGAAAAAWNAPKAPDAEPPKSLYVFFDSDEARFIEAACERLIPADESGPGAFGAGVPHFLDRQLAGEWGAGDRLYRSGPWQPGTPPQGYPLPFTPAALFRTALRAVNRGFAARSAVFNDLSVEAQDGYLRTLEAGAQDLDGVPSAAFFDLLLKMSVEGFFSNPVYAASRDRVAWRLIGFPGAHAQAVGTGIAMEPGGVNRDA